ncbi:hypothetical protein BDB01DRAFT_798663 [Pilobolus umbonatus]|nr:hypothetical protein BDB01DRAFT_798663 [Pilobolus umbonatus]
MNKSISLNTQLSDTRNHLPLTKENLKSLDRIEPNEIFKRYWQETPCASSPSQSSLHRRCQSTQPNPDVVVVSPRLLPFPYHNDSMFLPTAEQLQYRVANSSSAPPASNASHTGSYLHSFESSFSRSSTTHVPSIGSPQTFERRSLPARLDYSSHKHSSWGKKFGGRLLRKDTASSCCSSSIISTVDEDTPITTTTSNTNTSTTPQRKHWIKRIFKVFSSKKKSDIKKEDAGRVWYCEYSKNPSPYHDQQEITFSVC